MRRRESTGVIKIEPKAHYVIVDGVTKSTKSPEAIKQRHAEKISNKPVEDYSQPRIETEEIGEIDEDSNLVPAEIVKEENDENEKADDENKEIPIAEQDEEKPDLESSINIKFESDENEDTDKDEKV